MELEDLFSDSYRLKIVRLTAFNIFLWNEDRHKHEVTYIVTCCPVSYHTLYQLICALVDKKIED